MGHGLIAQAFHQYIDDKNILIFASGVSDSKACTLWDCNREEILIRKTLTKYAKQTLFIYFSSCSINSSNLTNDIYHTHKKNMENIISAHSNKSIIFRLSNIVGRTSNTNTLFYYLANKIKLQEEFNLWSGAKRNIIDIDDVLSIINYIIYNDLFKNEIINIANLKDLTVNEIVYELSKYLDINAKYSVVKCEDNYHINTLKIKPIVHKLGLDFGEDYLKGIISKYISR